MLSREQCSLIRKFEDPEIRIFGKFKIRDVENQKIKSKIHRFKSGKI